MGGYELVRSDDAPALAVDLEAGERSHGDHYPNGRVSKQAALPSPVPARQRLVSLDVFRGITVLVRTHNTHHLLLSARP
jgi:heparan-alpha-glucosaminide N-acetyltransferase